MSGLIACFPAAPSPAAAAAAAAAAAGGGAAGASKQQQAQLQQLGAPASANTSGSFSDKHTSALGERRRRVVALRALFASSHVTHHTQRHQVTHHATCRT
jgi:hypothetical protein